MNFLELVQALHAECGASGSAPVTVENQRGENQRLVQWVRRADLAVQRLWPVSWKFLRVPYEDMLTSGQSLSPPTNLGVWDLETFKLREDGTDEFFPLDAVEYEYVKGEVRETSQGLPYRVIVMPNNELVFEQVPDAAHTLRADYYRRPAQMNANTDQSLIPSQFRDVILGQAMMYYANHEAAPEIKQGGAELYAETLSRLEHHQLPNQNYARFRSGGHFEVVGGQ